MFGKIDEFDASKEEWSQYVERLTLANGIDEAAKKSSIFVCDWPCHLQIAEKITSSDKTWQKSVRCFNYYIVSTFQPSSIRDCSTI